jgi:hypothetical protein
MKAFYEATQADHLDPIKIFEEMASIGEQSVLVDEDALPDEFFDLSTGVAGEFLNKMAVYRVRLACVISDLSSHSEHFQAFAREFNRGRDMRFFSTREDAIKWL